jgi:uncharacterized protein (TIGR00661 family)
MKLLYGIQLTGNGHITRSIQIIKSLKERGFDVDIITSGNNSQLEIPYEIKSHHNGISMFYNKNGGIDWFSTIKNVELKKFIKDIDYDVTEYDLVISDFEPISAWSARRQNVKSIGIGNQYSFLSKNISRPKNKSKIAEIFLKNFAPCDFNIGLGYDNYDDFIVKPIINEDLLGKKITNDEFILIYLPSLSTDFIFEQVKYFNEYKWRIYSPDIKEDIEKEGVLLKRPNKEEFVKDLLSCSGVITASGFSTTSEALILNKKLWSIPIKKQYEQLCNAIELKKMGVMTDDLSFDSISKWLTNYKSIDYQWENPIDDIIEKIINYCGEN